MSTDASNALFEDFKSSVLNIDPVSFVENNLTIDGEKFDLSGGYKPFSDIYRYICLKAVEPDTLPVLLVKGRQVGATVMAAALECYFVACGLYGASNRPPMRVMHLFPTLPLAAGYSKSKLTPMIKHSKFTGAKKASGKPISFVEAKMDKSSPANDSMHFKQFLGGNQIWVESTGIDGDRVRGKQLCLETELPTPDRGFVKLKDIKEGDKLFDENGDHCNVIKVHPIQHSPEAYRITFDDGTVIDACSDHLWLTHTKRDRINIRKGIYKPTLRNTKDILKTLINQKERNHSIPLCAPVKYSKKELPIDPYLLGFWLGDGDRYGRIETADPEVLQNYEHRVVPSSVNQIKKCNNRPSKSNSYRVIGLTTALTDLGLVYNPCKRKKDQGFGFYKKIIPDIYKYSSYEQRLALLQGLMDSDGCCNKDGRCEFTQCELRKDLANDVLDLINSLGIKTSLIKSESWHYETRYQDRYRIQFYTTLPVFKLQRKLKNLKTKLTKSVKRYITSIIPIVSKPMRCITVDSKSHLYLITRSFIATHNTVDVLFFDECFPYDQYIETENGNQKIGKLYDMFKAGERLPRVQSYNEELEIFEYKEIINAWDRGVRDLIQITFENRELKCTLEHPFLTPNGWVKAKNLRPWDLCLVRNAAKKYELVEGIEPAEPERVYDIEVKDNHNFIAVQNESGLVVHNCQDMTELSIGAVGKTAAQAKYGARNQGVKVLFGTPKQKGGVYWKMWQASSQQYFHLHCASCEKHFPLYRPDVDWEAIWLYDFIVKCTHCGHEQDKRVAAAKGKWIPIRADHLDEPKMIGYHINQLYIPTFKKKDITDQKPENHASNSERLYQNEVLGEFYDGEAGTITIQEIVDKCMEDRRFAKIITPSDNIRVYAGFDWGQRSNLEIVSGKRQGKSYSCAVILTAHGPGLFSVDFATRLTRNDPEYKKETVEELFRRYSIHTAVGDIGDAGDLTHTLQMMHGEQFLGSRASAKVNNYIKYDSDVFPKVITFEKDYYISELLDLLRKGAIKFPQKSWDRIDWLVQHCASMEIKITQDKSGEPIRRYVKGSTPNDGLMALLNAYLAWKWDVTQKFNIKNPNNMKHENTQNKASLVPIIGHVKI